jgi:hypothetical protein
MKLYDVPDFESEEAVFEYEKRKDRVMLLRQVQG